MALLILRYIFKHNEVKCNYSSRIERSKHKLEFIGFPFIHSCFPFNLPLLKIVLCQNFCFKKVVFFILFNKFPTSFCGGNKDCSSFYFISFQKFGRK